MQKEARILGAMCPSLSPFPPMLMAFCCASACWAAQAQDSAPESSLAFNLRREAIALENGEGVPRNPVLAAALYCKSARLGDQEAQYNLGWMYANGRGVARNDAAAAFFFHAAAEQGLAAAQRMLKVVGDPGADVPECMRPPAPPPAAARPVVTAKPKVDYQAIAPRKIFDLVMKLAPQFKVEPQLALAIIAAESNFNTSALSPKNAKGLMQLIPETSERFNVRNPYDPAQNIRGGLTYLRWLLAYFQGDIALVAAAYNAGEGKVERYRGIPPYLETRAYVEKILNSVGASMHPFDETVTQPSPSLALIQLPWRVK
ncbi:transglycosylase SLT domain-containing protein [Rhodoferax sp. UBA5149]|uniref:transglycosylase SLT domain-containing protein n=1 Tax=Rhodoferax sp. UBA5149 TaxID=1947379 RepID=UPI0025E8BDB9|nr:transglycosylase SLT domain-containing protein [Rhodoferax sp. UBA5149]